MILSLLKSNRIPAAFALLSALLYWVFAYDLVRHDFPKLICLLAALFFVTYKLIRSYGWNFWLLGGLGILFRIIFIPAIPNLSQDFYRFIWDGQLLLQGVNPYLFTPETYLNGSLPSNTIFINQAGELYKGMGELNGSHYSNYPPINQLCFAIAAFFGGKSIMGTTVVLRLLIILADIGILYFGKKLLERLHLPVKNIFWYFLNPFIIVELTGNLHFEGVMLFFVVWALYLLHKRKWAWAAILWGLSISIKLIPLLLLPIFFKYFIRKGSLIKGFWKLKKFYWLVLGTVILSFAPFISTKFVSNFSATISLWFQNFEFNASIYYIIRYIGFQTIGWNIIAEVGKVLPVIIVLLILILSFFRKNNTIGQVITGLLFGICGYFLLSTTVHPWYIATPVILSVFTKYRFPIVWSFMVMFSYTAYGVAGFEENLWIVTLEYTLVIGFFIWEVFLKKEPSNTNKPSILA